MSRRAFWILFVVCLGIAFALITWWAARPLRLPELSLAPQNHSTNAAAPAFAPARPMVMRRWLWPQDLPEDGAFALILTQHATGAQPVIITDTAVLRREALTAYVDFTHLDANQSTAAVVFTLGQALQNWKDFALLLHDGEVVDILRCWACDVNSPDFKGADLGGLVAAGQPVALKRYRFQSDAEFQAALRVADQDPGTWIDRTKRFGRQEFGRGDSWVLPQWERLSE